MNIIKRKDNFTMSTTELNTAKKQSSATESKVRQRNWRRPRYDVSENDDAFSVSVVLPGVNRSGVDLSIEQDVLTIIGKRAVGLPEGWRPLRCELPDGDFRLSLQLNVDINEAQISARVEDGILELSLPKADEVKPRKIEVY